MRLWEEPDFEYPSGHERVVAERTPPGRRVAGKIVCNQGAEDECVVVTVEFGRPSRR